MAKVSTLWVQLNLRKVSLSHHPTTELSNRSDEVSSPSYQTMLCFYLSFVYWISLMFRGWTLAAANILHSKVSKYCICHLNAKRKKYLWHEYISARIFGGGFEDADDLHFTHLWVSNYVYLFSVTYVSLVILNICNNWQNYSFIPSGREPILADSGSQRTTTFGLHAVLVDDRQIRISRDSRPAHVDGQRVLRGHSRRRDVLSPRRSEIPCYLRNVREVDQPLNSHTIELYNYIGHQGTEVP